jgi:hypothetical protein
MQALPYDPTTTKIIACATVIEEMQPFLPQGLQHEVLDFGLHLVPNNLKNILQQTIDNHQDAIKTLILGYGLCSMAVVGLQTGNCTLVIPRVDDCIAIFLGSKKAYREQANKEPGTYYLTKGWIEAGDTPFSEYERLVEQYGEERADRIMGIILKHYTRLAYINTGHKDQNGYRKYARITAKKFNLRFEEIVGSATLVQKLLFGPWDDEILIAPPGHTIEYLDFKINKMLPGNT